MQHGGRYWIAAGVLLDLLGAVLIVTSLPQGGMLLAAGVSSLVAGSLVVYRGVLRLSPVREAAAPRARPQAATWQPEPELALPPPRRVRLGPSGRLLAMLWGSAILATGAVLYFAPRGPATVPALLEEHGVRTTGHIHRKNSLELAAGGTTFYLYYNFADQRQDRFRSSVQVSERLYRSYQVDDPVEVLYLPENPLVHVVPELTERPKSPWLTGAILALLAVLVVIAAFQRRRHKRLTANGVTAAGVVSELSRRGARQTFTVTYEVQGEEKSFRTSERIPSLTAGDRLTVLYLPDKPEDALLYRLSLYRAVGSSER